MIAAAALVLAGVVTPAAVGEAGSAADAMTAAIPMGCVLHASGLSPIRPERRKALAASGLQLVDAPPGSIVDDVSHVTPSNWGKAAYARVVWSGGAAWVIGFANGQCLIDATDANGAALLMAVRDQFETPGVPWKKLPAAAAPDRYGLAIQPPGKPAAAIIANLVGIDLPPSGRHEVITFEITPNQ